MAQGTVIEEPRQGQGAGGRIRDYLRGTYGALLVERAGRRPDLWGFVLMSVLGAAVFLLTADPKPQVSRLLQPSRDAFLHGRYWLDEAPSWLNELIPAGDGRWHRPLPADAGDPRAARSSPCSGASSRPRPTARSTPASRRASSTSCSGGWAWRSGSATGSR